MGVLNNADTFHQLQIIRISEIKQTGVLNSRVKFIGICNFHCKCKIMKSFKVKDTVEIQINGRHLDGIRKF